MNNENLKDYSAQLEAAKQFIIEHDQFLVVSHVHPDGDAISSTCAIGYLLEKLGKSFWMINESPIPPKLSYLYGSSNIIQFDENRSFNETFDAVIALDCADFERIGTVNSLFSDNTKLLNIDHHPTNDHYGTVQLIDPNAAATVEILFDLYSLFELPWDETIASCIYTGLLTDTGGFRYANTSPKVMKMASELLTYGVKGYELAEHLLEKTTMGHIRILKKALDSLSFSESNKICWLSVTKKDFEEAGASNQDLEGIVSYPRNIEGVEVGILFKELGPNEVKVSLRATGSVNVAEIAQQFGGGGHVRAAGATLNYPLEQSISLVIEKIKQVVE